MSLDGFRIEMHTILDQTRDVYRKGNGPAVLILSEVPGITPQVSAFANRVAAAGFSVWMPQLFGTPGKPMSIAYAGQIMLRMCVSREFSVFSANKSSPVVEWLRGLARIAHAECGGPGVGVVGMCLTGNFGLAMMLDAPVIAPVLSQPSLPVGLGDAAASLHVSPAEIEAAHKKIRNDGARILGLRFVQDPLCKGLRFERLRETFGDAFEGIEIDARHARKGTGTPAHSVLTTHLIDEEGEPTRQALDRTLSFLTEQLKA